LIADVQLDVARRGQHVCTLFPARHFHRHQDTWTTEVAMHSTWSRDLYTILHGAAGVRQADLTLVINPLVRWIWLGGWLFLVGCVLRLWPARVGASATPRIPRPKFLGRARKVSRRVRV
jgi:cytochrome c-type biogenesis protein CcmF